MTTQTDSAAPVKNRRTLLGRVVSNRMQKTVTVLVERRVKDRLMGKILMRSKKYHAHAPEGQYRNGDLVEIGECRPLSRTKAWTVMRLVEKSKEI